MSTHGGGSGNHGVRHHAEPVTRESHGGPFDPTGSTDGLYGAAHENAAAVEPVAWPELNQGVVGSGNIQADVVTAREILARTITAAEIAVGTLTSTEIMSGSIAVGDFAGPPTNLVTDPGFEVGGFWTGGTRSTAVTAHGGLYSLLVTAVTTEKETCAPFYVTGGRRYYVSGWARGLNTNTNAFTQGTSIRWLDSAGSTISETVVASGSTGKTNTFTQYRGFAVAPTTAVQAMVIFVHTGTGATATAYYDDAECVPADNDLSHASGNVVIDGTGITIINGAIRIYSDGGATVVIDGTHIIFQVITTGTLSVPRNNIAGEQSLNATIATGLTYDPYTRWSVKLTAKNGSGDWCQPVPFALPNTAGQVVEWYYGRARVTGGTSTQVQAIKGSSKPPLAIKALRYYVEDKTAL